jgi:hypothetical protein
MNINHIGVYRTEKGSDPVLISEDHGDVFLTPCHRYGWTREGIPNSPETLMDHGKIVGILYRLSNPYNGIVI